MKAVVRCQLTDRQPGALGAAAVWSRAAWRSGPRASSLLGYGNASPGSRAGQRHINDQMDRYSRKELKPVHLTRAEIAAHLEESVALSYP